MKNNSYSPVKEWLSRAESNFEIAKAGKRISKKVSYDDLCFECQQAAEKAIKAILIFYDLPFLKKHDIDYLLDLAKEAKVDVPPAIKETSFLSEYATDTRYPGNYDPANNKEYKTALRAAQKVLKWAKSIIEKKNGKLF